MKILEMAKRSMGIGEVDKRAGVFVSRKVLPHSAKKWYEWGLKHGIPNLVPAEEMHVTILYSTEDVKIPLVQTAINIESAPTYGWGGGCFAMFGVDDDTLVFAFRCWELHDRHWTFMDNGACCDWPTYRPHLTLSMDAAGYELPDAALEDVPALLVLGPEVSEGLKEKPTQTAKGDSRLQVGDELKAAAAELVKSGSDKMSAVDAYDLADIAHGRLSGDVAKRLAAQEWAPAELKAAVVSKPAETRKRVERELTISVSQISDDIFKQLKMSELAKANDEEQIVMGIASVSTVKGELVQDLHEEGLTTRALVEFNRSLITGSRAGKFDHEGDVCTEVVGGLVLTEEWQKSLGIDLGFEPYLVEIHVPDPKDWAEVKKGEWMLSVAGTMWYYEDDPE